MIIKKKEGPPRQTIAGRLSTHAAATGRDDPSPIPPRGDRGGSEHLGCCRARCAHFSLQPCSIIIYSFRDLEIPLPYQKNNESPSEKWALQKKGKKKKKKHPKKNKNHATFHVACIRSDGRTYLISDFYRALFFDAQWSS